MTTARKFATAPVDPVGGSAFPVAPSPFESLPHCRIISAAGASAATIWSAGVALVTALLAATLSA